MNLVEQAGQAHRLNDSASFLSDIGIARGRSLGWMREGCEASPMSLVPVPPSCHVVTNFETVYPRAMILHQDHMGQTRRNFKGIPGLSMCRGHDSATQVFSVPSDVKRRPFGHFSSYHTRVCRTGSDKLRNVSRGRLRATK